MADQPGKAPSPEQGGITCPCGERAHWARFSCDFHDPIRALQRIRALLANRERFVMLGMRSFAEVQDIVDSALGPIVDDAPEDAS